MNDNQSLGELYDTVICLLQGEWMQILREDANISDFLLRCLRGSRAAGDKAEETATINVLVGKLVALAGNDDFPNKFDIENELGIGKIESRVCVML